MPSGERLGRVASSDSRLYSRISIWPERRRCLPPRPVSGITMKVTWSDEMELAWRLFAISVSSSSLKGGPVHSHPRADVDVFARRYRGGAEADVAAIPVVATYDLDRVLTAVGDSAVERHGSTLIAIRRIHWPGVVVPAVLKVSGDLGQSERDKRRQDAESSPCQHAGGGEEKVKEENVKGT